MNNSGEEIPGFVNPSDEFKNDVESTKKAKKGNLRKGGGGFQSMGLSLEVLKGIRKRGYKIPTPIQRKTIPLALEGRDIVAMARTGSGKTACFLVPLLERLKQRTARTGARALILSPTRELALQTARFLRELGQWVGLRACVIVGGDALDEQFGALQRQPDVLVATPGRFLHVCVEMDLRLQHVEYVVLDEADRLFEMGLSEQLTEIMRRLPERRQTLLFSATLPRLLVDFARAGLADPVLVRLDVDTKLPELLQLHFVASRPDERVAALLVLLQHVLHIQQEQIAVAIFAATKHHVEYLHMILDYASIPNTYIYSSLDASARKIHAAKFSNGKAKVLVVTDVAARGLDIPHLDVVVNFNFPAKAKLFVHRVGRCARAGRSGIAYSLIAPDEHAHLLDLHLFLGRPFQMQNIGRIPQEILEEHLGFVLKWHEIHSELQSMAKVCDNAYKQYLRSRPSASVDSNRRVKQMAFGTVRVHPVFDTDDASVAATNARQTILNQMKHYRPQGTIFEICSKNKSSDYIAMKVKRALHKEQILLHHGKQKDLEMNADETATNTHLELSKSEDIRDAFQQVIQGKKRKLDDLYKKKKCKKPVLDQDHYIPYAAPDQHTEEGLALTSNSFERDASNAQLDLTGDSSESLRLAQRCKHWDRKKKRMVSGQDSTKATKRILTESGVWIPASFKTNRYEEWKQRTKSSQVDTDSADQPKPIHESNINTHWGRHNRKLLKKATQSELKTTEQILKARRLAAKKRRRNGPTKKGNHRAKIKSYNQ